MRFARGLIACGLWAVASGAVAGEPLFQFDGKSYSAADLSNSAKQAVFELESKRYEKLKSLAEDAAIDRYVKTRAKKKEKSPSEIREALFSVEEPSEKELKSWYKANQGRLPSSYSFEAVKSNIVSLLTNQKKQAGREELLDKLRKKGRYELAVKAPVAPQVDIDTHGYPVKGKKTAPVTVVEFADYQCPHCQSAARVIDEVLDGYEDKVNFIFMDYPLGNHDQARQIARGAQCAQKQDEFWTYHDKAFALQKSLGSTAALTVAKKTGLNITKFRHCMTEDGPGQVVDAAKEEGKRVGISGTPTIFVEGRQITGYSKEALEGAIERELARNGSSKEGA